MTQPSLFDLAVHPRDPERAKTDAIAKCEANNREWIDLAYQSLARLAFLKLNITSLDIWQRLPASLPPPTNPRAMGAAFVRARNAGLISPTNQWVKSGRVSDHNQQLRVWKSEVYRG